MTISSLLGDLRRRGIELRVDGDQIHYRPTAAVTPEIHEQLSAWRGALVAHSRGEPFTPTVTDTANEENWRNLQESDYGYLTGPRSYPNPCLHCGGRFKHSRACAEIGLN